VERTPLQIIADPAVSEEELIDAVGRLGAVTEPSSFWADLANRADRSPNQRRLYVLQLFRRHVSAGMSLSELAQILNKPAWLSDETFEVVEDLGGTIPVRLTEDNTVFVLRLIPDRETSEIWAIYVSVTGKHSTGQLYTALRGDAVDASIARERILEVGFSPLTQQTTPAHR